MPAAVKLQKQYGDDLQVIFVESQNSGYGKSVGMATKSGWLGNQAIWTNNHPFSIAGNGLPKFALLDGDGKIVLQGSSSSLHGKMVDKIEELIQEKKQGPTNVPSKLAKVYTDLGQGNFAKAVARAEKVLAKPGSKNPETIVAAAEASLKAAQERLDAQLARADWLLANGYPLRAKALADTLIKGTKGNDSMSVKVSELKTKLADEQYKADFSAAKGLAKLETALYKDGGSDKLVKKLQQFADDNASSPVAKRAEKLVDVARYSLL